MNKLTAEDNVILEDIRLSLVLVTTLYRLMALQTQHALKQIDELLHDPPIKVHNPELQEQLKRDNKNGTHYRLLLISIGDILESYKLIEQAEDEDIIQKLQMLTLIGETFNTNALRMYHLRHTATDTIKYKLDPFDVRLFVIYPERLKTYEEKVIAQRDLII